MQKYAVVQNLNNGKWSYTFKTAKNTQEILRQIFASEVSLCGNIDD